MSRPIHLHLPIAAGLVATLLLAGCGKAASDGTSAAPAEPVAQAEAAAPAEVATPAEPVVSAEAMTPPGAQRVEFAAGASSATVSGAVTGYDTPSYVVSARQGQTMTVSISGSSNASFNIFRPGDKPGEAEAMFIGDTGGQRFSGALPETGDYLVQVGQPRAVARRGTASNFTLNIAVAGG